MLMDWFDGTGTGYIIIWEYERYRLWLNECNGKLNVLAQCVVYGCVTVTVTIVSLFIFVSAGERGNSEFLFLHHGLRCATGQTITQINEWDLNLFQMCITYYIYIIFTHPNELNKKRATKKSLFLLLIAFTFRFQVNSLSASALIKPLYRMKSLK